MKLYHAIVGLVIFCLATITIITPFFIDILVSFGASFQADYFGSFPQNVYQSWNLRGLGYNYIIYILGKIPILFGEVEFNTYQKIIIAFYYTTFLSASFFAFKIARGFLSEKNLDWKKLFLLYTVIILGNSHYIRMQAEEIAIFVALLQTTLLLTNSKVLHFLAGFLVAILFSLKAITIFYAGFPLLVAIYLHNTRPKVLFRFLFGCVIFTILTIFFYWFVIPLEIENLIDASSFQSSFRFKLTTPALLFYKMIRAANSIPILSISMVLFGLLLVKVRRNKQHLILLTALFLVPALYVIIQHRWCEYHYTIFIPFSFMVTMLAQPSLFSIKNNKNGVALLLTYTAIVGFFILTPVGIPHLKFESSCIFHEQKNYADVRFKTYTGITSKGYLDPSEQVLYLSDGSLNFYIRNKSYLRHFYPLATQRLEHYEFYKKNDKLRNSKIYKDQVKAITGYNGRLIIHQPHWYNINSLPEIKAAIEERFEVIDSYETQDFPYNNYIVYRNKSFDTTGKAID